ncbi:DUF6562 domain-containing protein [Phocaeicola sp.]
MRKWNFILSVLLLLGTVSCSQEELNHSGTEGGDLVSITLEAPQRIETRASSSNTLNSASGGIDNVDWALYDLRYQLAVYDETGTKQVITTRREVVTGGYGPVTFKFRLFSGHTYKFVSWADFVEKGTTEDLHYNTDDLTKVTIKDLSAIRLNDESRDAYFITKNITTTKAFSETLTLKRPFSKLRVITTDWNCEELPMPDNFKITYHNCKRFEGINAITGDAITSDGATDGKVLDDTGITTNISVDKDVKYYQAGYDAEDNNHTLFTDYLFVNERQEPIHFKLEIFDGATSIVTKDFTTNIPVQRNWLTTILGNLLTTQGDVTVSINDTFTNEHSVHWWEGSGFTPSKPTLVGSTYHITKPEEFLWLSENVTSSVLRKTVVLDADIDMNGMNWQPIHLSSTDQTYTFDGQGYTIRNINVNGKSGATMVDPDIGQHSIYSGVFGRFAGEMKNVTFENIVINDFANSVIDKDENGDPIDHSKEAAYYAGVIGSTGTDNTKFENIHVKNITIKASSGKPAERVGGLVGYSRNASFTNCTVKGANLIGTKTGGLIGESNVGAKLTNCSAENITIRARSYSGGPIYVSGFVGYITSGMNTEFKGCTAPTNLILLDDTDGSIFEYSPANELYGKCYSFEEQIVIQ